MDIIIFELETGRAESMKEALQQADLAARHNEIKKTIVMAASAVAHSITSSIEALSRSIEYQLGEISSNQTDIKNALGRIANAQELNNALLTKANVSSEQLAKDMERIRYIEDQKYYGKK